MTLVEKKWQTKSHEYPCLYAYTVSSFNEYRCCDILLIIIEYSLFQLLPYIRSYTEYIDSLDISYMLNTAAVSL